MSLWCTHAVLLCLTLAGPYCALCVTNATDSDQNFFYDKGESTCRACADRDHTITIILCFTLGCLLIVGWGITLLPQTRTVFGYQRHVVKEHVKMIAKLFRPVVSFVQVIAYLVVAVVTVTVVVTVAETVIWMAVAMRGYSA